MLQKEVNLCLKQERISAFQVRSIHLIHLKVHFSYPNGISCFLVFSVVTYFWAILHNFHFVLHLRILYICTEKLDKKNIVFVVSWRMRSCWKTQSSGLIRVRQRHLVKMNYIKAFHLTVTLSVWFPCITLNKCFPSQIWDPFVWCMNI